MHRNLSYLRGVLVVSGFILFLYVMIFSPPPRHSGLHERVAWDSTRSRSRARRSTSTNSGKAPQHPFQIGPAFDCPLVQSAADFNQKYGDWELDTTFYTKVAGDPYAGDIPVVSSDLASDTAVQEAFLLANKRVLINIRADVMADLRATKARVVILRSPIERAHTIPEYGLDNFATVALLTTEDNVLCYNRDPRRGESLLIQSLANAIRRILEERDHNFTRELHSLYANASQLGTYSDNSFVDSLKTYWSENTKNFFSANVAAFKVSTRKSLRAHDPQMEKLLVSIFGEIGYYHGCPLIDADGHLEGCKGIPSRPYPPPLNVLRGADGTQEWSPPPAATSFIEKLNQTDAQEHKEAQAPSTGCQPEQIQCAKSNVLIYHQCADDGTWFQREAPPGTECHEVDGIVQFLNPARSTDPVKPASDSRDPNSPSELAVEQQKADDRIPELIVEAEVQPAGDSPGTGEPAEPAVAEWNAVRIPRHERF